MLPVSACTAAAHEASVPDPASAVSVAGVTFFCLFGEVSLPLSACPLDVAFESAANQAKIRVTIHVATRLPGIERPHPASASTKATAECSQFTNYARG